MAAEAAYPDTETAVDWEITVVLAEVTEGCEKAVIV